jgi:hypothetical protein
VVFLNRRGIESDESVTCGAILSPCRGNWEAIESRPGASLRYAPPCPRLPSTTPPGRKCGKSVGGGGTSALPPSSVARNQ